MEKIELNRIYNMDCLEGMRQIEDKSIDMILCDLPYGQTQNEWDSIIPLDKLWKEYLRIINPSAAILLFGQGMFTAELMFSNKEMWRYNLIWKKGSRPTGFLNAKKMPLRNHEDVLIFYKELPTYNPQFTRGKPTHKRDKPCITNNTYGDFDIIPQCDYGNDKFPMSILDFPRRHPPIHPTEKSIPLCEYLIKTYSNEGDLILDNCIGCGTTAVSAIRTGRNFIGYEIEKPFFELAQSEIKKAQEQGKISEWF